MAKPPPTRTQAKAPVSLPSVKALSSTPADAKPAPFASVAKPVFPPVAAPVAPPPARPAPVVVQATVPASAAPVVKAAPSAPLAPVAKPVSPPVAAPVTPSPARPAPAIVQATVPASAAPAVKAAPSTPVAASAKVPGKPLKKAVSAKLRIEKPVSKIVAPKKSAQSAQASKAQPVKPARPAPVATKPDVAKPAEQPKPAVRVAAPVKPESVAALSPAPKLVEPIPAVVAAAREPAKSASLESLPLPRPPEFAAVASETVMSQALTMARAFGALQAKMIEHACAEFKATLGDAETLARSDSPSEAIALQAKAVRRSYESYAEHLKELARIANTTLRKG